MRLIDADALWEILREKQNSLTARCGGYRFLDGEDRAKYDGLEITLAYIDDAPTIDAVPVVRCKECEYYNTTGCSKGFGWCENIDRGTSDNFYCANGKQLNKESEDD